MTAPSLTGDALDRLEVEPFSDYDLEQIKVNSHAGVGMHIVSEQTLDCLIAQARRAPPSDAGGRAEGDYQARVGAWMDDVFAAGGADVRTRIDRFLEEAFELAQALDYDPGRIAAIRDYVFARPVGEKGQEMGGVMVTLASLAHAAEIGMEAEAEAELARIHRPEVRAKIMAKQASKNALHTPLPTAMDAAIAEGRTFPIPPEGGSAGALREALKRVTRFAVHGRAFGGTWGSHHELRDDLRIILAAHQPPVGGETERLRTSCEALVADWSGMATTWASSGGRAGLKHAATTLSDLLASTGSEGAG